MNPFGAKRNPNRVRFRAMMESGSLIDEQAEIIQTQVIAHKARASIRNRDTVPLYHQTEENRSPVWRENILVETGLSPPPGMDSRYNLEDSRNLFAGIRSGAVEIDPDSPVRSHGFAIIANLAAVIVFLACAWLAGINSEPEPSRAAVADAVEQQVEERIVHGPVDTISDEEAAGEGAEEESEAGGGGADDTGQGSEQSVVPGGVGDSASSVP